jgi:catechol-2,3-dioxygenase
LYKPRPLRDAEICGNIKEQGESMKIKKLTIFSASLGQQFQFYCNALSLTCIEKNDRSFTIQTGNSLFEIVTTEKILPSKYHLAFNIEPSLIYSAADYLKARNISLLENAQQVIVDFPDWNAKSVYFFDADGNILEFIARYNLTADKYDRPFTVKDIYSISEAGVPVDDTAAFITALKQYTNIDTWKSYGTDFVAAGDEKGLLIVVKQPRDWLFTKISALQLPMEIIMDQAGNNFDYGKIKFSFTQKKAGSYP